VDDLPKGPSGKVQRLKLKDTAAAMALRAGPRDLPAGDTPAEKRAFTEPRTEVEKALARIWSDLLGVSRLSVYDDFFDLGGYSLLATRVLSQVSDEFAVSLPLSAFFERPRLADQAVLVVQALLEQAGDDETHALLDDMRESPRSQSDAGPAQS
jgi:hypothetical protein